MNRLLMPLLLLFFSITQALAAGNREPATTVPADVRDAPQEMLGTVIGTLGLRYDYTPRVDRSTLVFRRQGSLDVGYYSVLRRTLKSSRGGSDVLVDGKFRYGAFTLSLPEGRYELVRVVNEYFIGLACGEHMQYPNERTMRNGNLEDFSVPFEVKRGKTLYLGSFLAHGTVLKKTGCLLSLPFPSTAYLSWANKWTRDSALFSGLGVDTSNVELAALAVNETTGYYIIAEDHLDDPLFKPAMSIHPEWTHQAKIGRYQAEHPASGDFVHAAAATAAAAVAPVPPLAVPASH